MFLPPVCPSRSHPESLSDNDACAPLAVLGPCSATCAGAIAQDHARGRQGLWLHSHNKQVTEPGKISMPEIRGPYYSSMGRRYLELEDVVEMRDHTVFYCLRKLEC